MKTWLSYLNEYTEQHSSGDSSFIIKKATDKEISKLRKEMTKNNLHISEGYFTVLKQMDGIDFRGMMIFGCKEYVSYRNCSIFGLMDSNLDIKDGFPDDKDTYYGRARDDLLAYSEKLKKYVLMDAVSGTTFEQYDTFMEMLSDWMRVMSNE